MSREPGWDSKAISQIATRHYGGYTQMFEHHGWPERGKFMMPKVQTRVKDAYGSIAAFVEKHRSDP